MNRIIHGDALEELPKLGAESVDLLCTDPPYGYSFMGKSWDKALPDIGVFKECLRVLKPGAFAFVMSAPRSDVCARMMFLLEDAGFNIGFTPIYWTYATGFPKAMNIGKMVDKRSGTERRHIRYDRHGATALGLMNDDNWKATPLVPVTTGSSSLEGSYGGFQPKPAVEVIIVAMKPLSEKTYVDQALKNGKGITWLDDCRVPLNGEKTQPFAFKKKPVGYGFQDREEAPREQHGGGRFPANLIVSDAVLGDHSRFFALPFLIVPKPAKSEKNKGLDGFEKTRTGVYDDDNYVWAKNGNGSPRGKKVEAKANHHPTVKPLTLMSYLITLGSRPGDTVLDPFLGSGTTAIAAKQLGRECIGIEREEEYVDIAEARLAVSVPTLL